MMGTLIEIESAAEKLPLEEKRKLFQFLAKQLSHQGERAAKKPEPRKFTREQIAEWVERDEEDMRRFNEGQ
jgi:hypothetical protein